MPLFWHGAPRHGAHLDIRLMSAGPEQSRGKTLDEHKENDGKMLAKTAKRGFEQSAHVLGLKAAVLKAQYSIYKGIKCYTFIPRIRIPMICKNLLL